VVAANGVGILDTLWPLAQLSQETRFLGDLRLGLGTGWAYAFTGDAVRRDLFYAFGCGAKWGGGG